MGVDRPLWEKTNSTRRNRDASTRFDSGPAAEIQSPIRFGLFRFNGLTGTGLAQPSTGRFGAIMPRRGKTTVPIGSMCASGLRETRPSILAVGSPKRFEVQACAVS